MPNENVADTNVTADQAWQNELDGVLLSESSDEQKVSRLLQLLPTLKEPAQVEISQHLINFVSDDNYSATGQILTNATTAE